jgi:signal transduction histidine kinase
MRRWWPNSLAGQLIAGLLLVMTAASLISFFAFIDERRLAVHEASRFQSLARVASVVRLVEDAPADMRAELVRNAGGPLLRFTLSPESKVDDDAVGFRARLIRRRLARRLGGDDRTIRIAALGGSGEIDESDGFWRWSPWRHLRHRHNRIGDDATADEDDDDDDRRYWRNRMREMPGMRGMMGMRGMAGMRGRGGDIAATAGGMLIAVRLNNGNWLNARTLLPPVAPSWAVASSTAMAATALALVLLIVLLVRRATRPLAGLAAAAERAGRGEAFTPLREEGPSDVRETIAAFNRMQERQQRFIADRTRMLAAISHDLRTPITSLRLRAEFIEDAELRARISATLDEMQAMAEATLGFVREDATEEDFQETDLGALADSVCADFADLGKAARFTPVAGGRVIVNCRPNALRRALRNIVDNALAYGGSADIHIERQPDGIAIVVEDDGPGIAESDLQRVFEPFVRLEESRSRGTGGMGLGMSIARTILRAHGGDIGITNRAEGGLRVALRLPPEAAANSDT